MTRIAIFYCRKIKDHSCVACAKCFKGMAEKNGEFSRYKEIEMVAMTDCGDCPGLCAPRAKLVTETARNMGRQIEALHLGTCVKAAIKTAECPINFDKVKPILEKITGAEVVLGTHDY